MVRDLSDPIQSRRRMQDNVRRTNSRTRAQSTSVDRGAFRVKSPEGLEVGTAEDPTGSGTVYGILRILGELLLQGDMDVTGGGQITVGGVLITPLGGGRIRVGANITLDAATQKISVGSGANVIVLDAVAQTITVGTGAGKIALDAAGRKISVGTGARLVATANGDARLEVGSGDKMVSLDSSYESPRVNLGKAQIESATGESITFTMGTKVVYFHDNTIRIPGLASPPADATGLKYAVVDSLGRFWAAPSGGPIPGEPGNPGTPGQPGDNPAGYIYPVNPDAWQLGDDFAAHVARGSQEPGIDWFTSWGTPVWAPGAGTIVDVKPTNSDATGRYVTLVTDAGDWFRFLHLSSFPVSPGQRVAQGDVIAYTGGSGFGSDVGYGLHIHVSFKRGYTGAGWPGASALDDLGAYMADAA